MYYFCRNWYESSESKRSYEVWTKKWSNSSIELDKEEMAEADNKLQEIFCSSMDKHFPGKFVENLRNR